jgi:hypothetical protein
MIDYYTRKITVLFFNCCDGGGGFFVVYGFRGLVIVYDSFLVYRLSFLALIFMEVTEVKEVMEVR